MFRRYPILIILLAVATIPAHGQLAFTSLESVWSYADAHNITIRISKYEVDRSVYSKRQTYGTLLPQLSANGSYTDNLALQTTLIPADLLPNGAPGVYRELQFGQQFVYAGGLAAQWNILNLQNWYNAKIALQTEEMNRDSLANTRKSVYQQIATQYYSYILMQEAYRLAVESARIADSVYQTTDNKYKEGTVNEANVDVAQLNLERANQNAISAKYQAMTAKNNLKALLGLSLTDSMEINASLRNDLKIDVAGSFTEDPAIRIAATKTALSLSQYRAANSAFTPTFSLVYNVTTQRYDKTFEPFNDATGTAAWFPAQYWALQASLPIFSGGSRFYNSRKSKIAYEESKELYEYTRKQSAINDENTRLNYEKAVAVLMKAEQVMNLSFDNYKHVSYRYEAGIAPIDDRLNAFKDYIDYQNQYLSSLSDMLIQLYQVKLRQQQFR
jgi:outer membrane protein